MESKFGFHKTVQFRDMFVWIIIILLNYLSNHLHFITNGFKHFQRPTRPVQGNMFLYFNSLTKHLVSRVSWPSVGSKPGRDICVPEQDTYNCISLPRGQWVPVRAAMVLLTDLADNAY